MTRKKISPKIQQAAEKYLGSLGSSRTDLTDKQWEIVVNHVKTQRMRVPILLVFGIIFAGLSLWAFWLGKKGMDSIMPNETSLVTFVSKAGDKSVSLNPDDMKNYIKAVTELYWQCGLSFTLAISFFVFAFITIPLTRRGNKRIFEAFIPHRQETISPRNRTSLE